MLLIKRRCTRAPATTSLMHHMTLLPHDALLHSLSAWFVGAIQRSLCTKEYCLIALSGGNTPAPFYEMLATAPYRDQIPWDRVHIFLTDERFSPAAGSNEQMIHASLLNRISIPANHIHRVNINAHTANIAAIEYADSIQRCFQQCAQTFFDIALLGIGEDGHIASLFPNTTILQSEHPQADAAYIDKLDAWRVSLTFPCLLQIKHIAFLASYARKKTVLQNLQKNNKIALQYPVSLLLSQRQDVAWFLSL